MVGQGVRPRRDGLSRGGHSLRRGDQRRSQARADRRQLEPNGRKLPGTIPQAPRTQAPGRAQAKRTVGSLGPVSRTRFRRQAPAWLGPGFLGWASPCGNAPRGVPGGVQSDGAGEAGCIGGKRLSGFGPPAPGHRSIGFPSAPRSIESRPILAAPLTSSVQCTRHASSGSRREAKQIQPSSSIARFRGAMCRGRGAQLDFTQQAEVSREGWHRASCNSRLRASAECGGRNRLQSHERIGYARRAS